MPGPVALGDRTGARELVERRLLEADREGANSVSRLLRGERRQCARVDAAGEQDADGDVGDQVRTHRVAQARPALLDELRLVVVRSLGQRARPGVPLDRRTVVRPAQRVSGRQLPDLAEDRERRRDDVEREERLERIEVELAGRQRVQL